MGNKEFDLGAFLKETDSSKLPPPHDFDFKAILRNIMYFSIIIFIGFLTFVLSYVISTWLLPVLISDPEKRWSWDYGVLFVLVEAFVFFWLIFSHRLIRKWENHVTHYEKKMLLELLE
ncbi:MAG: hypothetical protein ACTSYA_07290 [Candidatus Kariarchaeaceae archaeon]